MTFFFFFCPSAETSNRSETEAVALKQANMTSAIYKWLLGWVRSAKCVSELLPLFLKCGLAGFVRPRHMNSVNVRIS